MLFEVSSQLALNAHVHLNRTRRLVIGREQSDAVDVGRKRQRVADKVAVRLRARRQRRRLENLLRLRDLVTAQRASCERAP